MRISIVIPAHNEAKYLLECLQSWAAQTHLPDEVVIVDDNSTDNTFAIAQDFSQKHAWATVIKHKSSEYHLPGKKVIDAFNYGLKHLNNIQLIGKFDADILLPTNYLEEILNQFQSNWKLGMASGLLYIQKNHQWIYENIADKNHVRGPIKMYHNACFEKIGGLRPGVGWDTVDTLLAKYHGFDTLTLKTLHVRHLRPTGHGYTHKTYQNKGLALYRMRYGLPLAKIALFKMSIQAKNPLLYFVGIWGFIRAYLKKEPRFVTKKEGRFIRKLRWNGIFKKLGIH